MTTSSSAKIVIRDLNQLSIDMQQVSPKERSDSMRIPKSKWLSDRGFGYFLWRDQYWQECRLSESSLATKECIWLGQTDVAMHLDREQARVLAALLLHFADNGELP